MLINTNSHMHVPILTMLRDVLQRQSNLFGINTSPGMWIYRLADPKGIVNIVW